MEEKIKEFWKQKQVAFYHIFLDVMLLIYCISFYFAGNQVVTIRYVILFVYALLCIVTELVHNRHMQKKYVHSKRIIQVEKVYCFLRPALGLAYYYMAETKLEGIIFLILFLIFGRRRYRKSGTSEQLNMDRRADGDYKKVASFAAVLPANDPEILVYVMLDDPNNARTDYSSILAAPVGGNIISEIAPYLGIATDGVDRSGTTVKVPNLTGKEWSNAQVQLNIKGLKHHLAESESDQTAALVTYQYPRAGAEVPYGTTVYLYTDTYEGKHAEVPDVTGKSADFARQMLNAAGLNCTVEGSGTVQSQSEAPGSSVQQGTIVHLICG